MHVYQAVIVYIAYGVFFRAQFILQPIFYQQHRVFLSDLTIAVEVIEQNAVGICLFGSAPGDCEWLVDVFRMLGVWAERYCQLVVCIIRIQSAVDVFEIVSVAVAVVEQVIIFRVVRIDCPELDSKVGVVLR